MKRKDELIRIFSREIRDTLNRTSVDFSQVQEIRLRVQAPLLMVMAGKEYYVTRAGALSGRRDEAYVVSREEMRETLEYISSHSLYAFEEEIRQGFLTIPGGHRIGIAGKAVVDDGGIRTIKNISFLNVRLAHQIVGCADGVMPYLFWEKRSWGDGREGNWQEMHQQMAENSDWGGNGGEEVLHTLIISPPRCGKTTLLRDIIRQLSDGSGGRAGVTVGVVDERSEIAACYQGVPQNDLGIRTDVLDCCPKARGMMMMIRTMSPQVIAVDEIGGRDDLEALQYVMNCGCKVVATVHGQSLEDIRRKPILGEMVKAQVFERYLVLDHQGGAGHVRQICDGDGRELRKSM